MASLSRIVSGGQTGPDRAALDVAQERGLPAGGWCPAGRWAEDGPIPDRYPLVETPEADPAVRTRRNVHDSDATLILSPLPLAGGTALTHEVAVAFGKPVYVVDPFVSGTDGAAGWLSSLPSNRIILNVAGPRESDEAGIGAASAAWLGRLLDRLAGRP